MPLCVLFPSFGVIMLNSKGTGERDLFMFFSMYSFFWFWGKWHPFIQRSLCGLLSMSTFCSQERSQTGTCVIPRKDFTESSHVNTAPDSVEQQRHQSSRLLINELVSAAGCLGVCCTSLEMWDNTRSAVISTPLTWPCLISKLSAVQAANYRLQAWLDLCLAI